MQSKSRKVLVLRWSARLTALALLLFWGQFFVAHLSWLQPPFPPLWVVGLLALHFVMLVGLAVGWKYELAGAAVVIGSAVPFFINSAGPNAAAFIAITCLPAALWIAAALLSHPRRNEATPPAGSLSVP